MRASWSNTASQPQDFKEKRGSFDQSSHSLLMSLNSAVMDSPDGMGIARSAVMLTIQVASCSVESGEDVISHR